MTALRKYARLEATGLWRSGPDAQRREVIVSVGDTTLVISDLNDRALTHWSLAAIGRNGAGLPAFYHPEGDGGETLELDGSETEMIAAIDTLRHAVDRARPHPGRLRWLGAVLSVTAVAALGHFWLPGALVDHAMRVVPEVKRAEIGAALLSRIERVSGPPCQTPGGLRALADISQRIGAARLVVLPGGVRDSLGLPGDTILLNRALVEDYEEPDVAAGYALAAHLRAADGAALRDLLIAAGPRATATLLTTGHLPAAALDAYAEMALAAPAPEVDETTLLAAFGGAGLRSTPYAYAIDISGETTLALIEADPTAGTQPAPLLRDADWLRLQAICEG